MDELEMIREVILFTAINLILFIVMLQKSLPLFLFLRVVMLAWGLVSFWSALISAFSVLKYLCNLILQSLISLPIDTNLHSFLRSEPKLIDLASLTQQVLWEALNSWVWGCYIQCIEDLFIEVFSLKDADVKLGARLTEESQLVLAWGHGLKKLEGGAGKELRGGVWERKVQKAAFPVKEKEGWADQEYQIVVCWSEGWELEISKQEIILG